MILRKTFSSLLAVLLICSMLLGTFVYGETVEAETVEAEVVDSIPASSVDPSLPEWTVMLYLCGTDLESDRGMATTNLEEISKTTPNDSVNVVIQTGGTNEWHAQELGLDIDTSKTQRYHFDSDGFTLDNEQPLQNMANPATLTEFIQYSAENFPAQKYLLVLWDHGGGSLSGMIIDEKYNGAMMSLEELEIALERAGVPIEAVLLDACLMASLETAQALQSTTHYLIASEESVPGHGSDFKRWLQYLYDMPECDGRLFGRRVCDSIQQKYAEFGFQYNGVTFSVIDLTKLDAVSEAFNQVFAELRPLVDDPNNMYVFTTAINRTENYSIPDMLDLGDLVFRARGLGISNTLSNKLLTSLADAVIYNVRGVDHSYSTGLSFYYCPSDHPVFLDHYARSCKSAEYLAYIDRVNTRWTAPGWVYDKVEYLPDITYEKYGIEPVIEVSEDNRLKLSFTNGNEAVAFIDLVLYVYEGEEKTLKDLEDGIWTRIGNDPFGINGDFATAEFEAVINGIIPTLDGVLCGMTILEENSEYTLFSVPVDIEDVGTANLLILYRFDEEIKYINPDVLSTDSVSYAGSYEVLGIQNATNNELPSRNVYTLEELEGTEATPVFTQVFFPSGEENGTVKTDSFILSSGLSVENTDLPAGIYAAAFSLKDVFGAVIETEMVPFIWDGESAVFGYSSFEAESAA